MRWWIERKQAGERARARESERQTDRPGEESIQWKEKINRGWGGAECLRDSLAVRHGVIMADSNHSCDSPSLSLSLPLPTHSLLMQASHKP